MTFDIIGGDARVGACRDFLDKSGKLARFSGVILLPVPSSRDGVVVNGTDITLSEIAARTHPGTLVVAYAAPATFAASVAERGGEIIDVSSDEDFLCENSRLTAECTLSYIMNTEGRAVSDMKIGVVGYGRIGRVLLELLLFLGSDVTVYTRSDTTRMGLLSLGAKSQLVAEADFSGLDLLVNTAPARLFTKGQCITLRCPVLELAPGENFPFVQNLTRLPSLPAKMLPKSSGKLYADAIIKSVTREA